MDYINIIQSIETFYLPMYLTLINKFGLRMLAKNDRPNEKLEKKYVFV